MSQGDLRRFETLLAGLFDDALSDDERRELEQILLNDSRARDLYCTYVKSHTLLTARSSGLGGQALVGLELPEANSTAGDSAVRSAGKSGASLLRTSFWRQHRVLFGAMALALTLLFWVGVGWVVFSRFGPHGDGPELAPTRVASVTRIADVAWAEGAREYKEQDELEAGDMLVVTRGFLEITFEQGAVVLVEGPAHFRIDSRGAGTLEHGRVVARVEGVEKRPEVIPFAIYTPLAQVIDLGTEFGVDAETEGSTEVEVFEGLVEATPQGEARTPASRPMRLFEGQSARIVPGGGQFELQEPSGFVREMPEGQLAPVVRTAVNDRLIYMMNARVHGDERMYLYATHGPAEENLLIAFDLSEYYGAKAAGSARLTLTIAEGVDGIKSEGAFELELRQLSPHNGAIDLDAASSWYIDGHKDTGSVPWRDGSGRALENVGYKWAVRDIAPVVLDSKRGPFAGDTATSPPTPGTQITFTISRARLQAWLDQAAPAIVVLDLDTERYPLVLPDGNATMIGMDGYEFGDGEGYAAPSLTFSVVEPATEAESAE